MSLKIVRGKNLPIGVDLGTSVTKLVQLRHIEEEYELVGAQAVEIPHDCRDDLAQRQAFLGDAIRKMMKAGCFRGHECILAIPAETTFVHHLKLPVLSAEDLPKAIRTELREKLPFDVDDAIIRHVVAGDLGGDSTPQQEVIVIAASRQVLASYLAMSRRAKMDVIGVNVEPCALVECFSRLFRRNADASRTILFVDMGAKSTQVVFSHGNRMVFARNLSIGGQDLHQAIAEGMQIPLEQARALRRSLLSEEMEDITRDQAYSLFEKPLEDLGEELHTCMRYYESVFRGRTIERVIFLGGQAYDKRLCQMLAQRLNVPAQIGDPLLRVKRAEVATAHDCLSRREPQPDWAVAIGLSIGAAAAA